jgi:hypothetical protein
MAFIKNLQAKGKTTDNITVIVNFQDALTEPTSGWVEIHGTAMPNDEINDSKVIYTAGSFVLIASTLIMNVSLSYLHNMSTNCFHSVLSSADCAGGRRIETY